MSQSGTHQNDRLPAPLLPTYFQPDELNLRERLRLTLAQAAQLRFVDAQGLEAGRWDQALLQDEAMLLADLSAFPLARERAAFEAEREAQALPAQWRRLWMLVEHADRWCQRLADHDTTPAQVIARALHAGITRRVAPLLSRCYAAFESTPAPLTLHRCWGLAAAASLAGEDDRPETLLRRCWNALCERIAALQDEAATQFEASLESGRHPPAVGLLLATQQLYHASRAPLNRFPDRLTDFYYDAVLRMRPRPAGVERINLLLEREPRHPLPVTVEAGQHFIGGKDTAGKPIVFAAERPIRLGDAKVAALCTIRLEADPLISPEHEFGYATRVKATTMPVQPAEASEQTDAAWWPLFGGRSGKDSGAFDAELGLMLNTSMLALGAGDRTVVITLHLMHPADRDETLKALLAIGVVRDEDWLKQTFHRYDLHEFAEHPEHNGPHGRPASPDPSALATQAWARAASQSGDVQLRYLLARCIAAADATSFRSRLGRLFAVWLTTPREALLDDDLVVLRRRAAELLGAGSGRRVDVDDPLSLITASRQPPERELIFDRIFRGLWRAQVSGSDGWFDIEHHFVQRASVAAGDHGGAIELSLRLGTDQPAVVACASSHGAGLPPLPGLRLTLRSQTRVYAYSLLRQLGLHSVEIDVSVRGLRDLILHNQLGRLDPGKPFLPFGPLPDTSSYLVLGCAELAAKPLRALALNLRWGRLPDADGGFDEHYRGYPGKWGTEVYKTRALILRDGDWQACAAEPLALFSGEAGSRRIAPTQVLALAPADLRRHHRAVSLHPGAAFDFGLHARNGFFRFELQQPAAAFGHALYPTLLSQVLTRNARYKRQDPLPGEPYTPTIERLSIDYSAHHTIPLSDVAAASRGDDQIQMIFPFGTEPLAPTAGSSPPRLLPRYDYDGNLYIGLSGSDPQGTLSLYFQLREESAAERWTDRKPALHWAVWCRGWQSLASQDLLFDDTQGLLRSGIVSLRLPGGMSTDCARLQTGFYWLRLGSDWGFEFFAGLYGVYAQAVSAARVQPAEDDEPPLVAGTIRTPLPSLPGLRSARQVGPSLGRRPVDPPSLLRTRSAERLRHKGRAGTAWDYERLVLDAFPEICKVKCFPHLRLPQDVDDDIGVGWRRAPGHILLVVVATPHRAEPFDRCQAPRLDAAALERVGDYVRARAPAGIQLTVRNASYEQIQVRAALRINRDAHPGATLRAANRALVDLLSPWPADGAGPSFDWEMRTDVVAALLRAQAGIDAVGRISLLQIVRSDHNRYTLGDTGREAALHQRLRPQHPWALMLPLRHHLLELLEPGEPLAPQPTGVRKLEVGSTFVIGGAS